MTQKFGLKPLAKVLGYSDGAISPEDFNMAAQKTVLSVRAILFQLGI